jgi:hypothetical protein
MKSNNIKPYVQDAREQIFRSSIVLKKLHFKLYEDLDEDEEKQILLKQQPLLQERLKARKILDKELFNKHNLKKNWKVRL